MTAQTHTGVCTNTGVCSGNKDGEADKRRGGEERVQSKWKERYQQPRTKAEDDGRDTEGNTAAAAALGEMEC